MASQLNIWLILLLPLLGGVSAYFVKEKWSGLTHVCFSGIGLILAVLALLGTAGLLWKTTWFVGGDFAFDIGWWYDRLSGAMLIIVALVALMVALFSLEYMKHDPAKNRYFALLGLFAFSMYGIVLSSNLLLTFVFWELVGFSSYLLIGFWYQNEAPPISSFKAFIMNRIGDGGFLLAIFIAFAYFHTLDIQSLLAFVNASGIENSGLPALMIFLLGIGLFLAAVGKSAQFPLQTWLPDAMTGPTPVSALIHAATMVAAGVYLMVRVYPLLSPDVLQIIAITGGITAFTGAFAAFAQNDIKKILAYSTVSQLGYMIMAVGAGHPLAAFFHLTTHAFFKAGLFLCAGSVIHYFHETNHEHGFDGQDIRNMGGLRKRLPFTFLAFTMCMLALTGIPLFSGFLSKEIILTGLSTSKNVPFFVVILGFASVFMTAAYMSRMYFQMFFGSKVQAEFKEPQVIKITLGVLSFLSLWIVFAWNPMDPNSNWLTTWLIPVSGMNMVGHHPLIAILSIGLALFGLFISYLYAGRHLMETQIEIVKRVFYRISRNNFYIDFFYTKVLTRFLMLLAEFVYFLDKKVLDRFIDYIAMAEVIFAHVIGWFDRDIIDGTVNMLARLVRFFGNRARSIQGGNVQMYFVWALVGMLAIFYFLN